MPLTVDEIGRLLHVRGAQQYGREAVSQLEHALQCAHLAEQAGETPHTVAAALLHDLGHLLAAEREHRNDDDQQRDDLHQHFAIPFLRGLLPDAVLEPIGLHVDAKRCLLHRGGVLGTLSPASKRNLELRQAMVRPDTGHGHRLPKKPCACAATTTGQSPACRRRGHPWPCWPDLG